MEYEKWRITFQSSEQAARAAFEEAQRWERLFAMAIGSIVELHEAVGIRREDQLTGGTAQALTAIEKLKERREKWKVRALEAEQLNREMTAKAVDGCMEDFRKLDRKNAAIEEERDALAACLQEAQTLADQDRIISYCMSPYPEGKPEGSLKGWNSRMGRDLHVILQKVDASLTRRDELVTGLREDVASLLRLIADIRAAAGDPHGKLMQPELIDHIAALNAHHIADASKMVVGSTVGELDVTASNETLSINIGIELLCHAVTVGRPYGNGDIKITDRDKFISSLVSELKSESEDGTTPVIAMFDETVNTMLENGEFGVDYEDESTQDEGDAQ
ncbi:hypothetical protein ACLUEY_01135 [Vreelandella aquamarina]